MAFEGLSERLENSFKKLRAKGKLTEADVKEAMREVRLALLEADVNYKVSKEFTAKVTERAIGADVMESLTPGQMVIKIVNEELTELMGGNEARLAIANHPPTIVMMCGLQGSGKTTHSAKLALKLKKEGHRPLLVACDVYRPAAIDQLQTIANQVGVDILNLGDKVSPVEIACRGVKKAYDERYDVVIIDTAGRLAIDEKLMQELVDIEEKVKPTEELLLVDAMSGQDAVNVAKAFNEKLHLTGMIMSKLDGDARGGAALSIKHLTGIPIKYAGVGEKLEDLEVFHPDRMADRILGMGDVVSLVEKVQEQIDEKQAKKTVNKMMSGHFDLNDMLAQMEQINKLGSMGGLLKLIPGMPKISEEDQEKAKKQMDKTKAIIFSMTPQERKDPSIIKNSRKVRIARGCGMTNQDVNRVLNQYDQMKKMMKEMGARTKGGKFPPFGGFGGKNPFGM